MGFFYFIIFINIIKHCIIRYMEIKEKLQDDMFKIPFDKVKLPSGGLLYSNKNIGELIDVQYMVTDDEDLLYSNKLMDNGFVFNQLVRNKLIDKSINVDELLIGDFNKILVFLRTSAYGPIYKVKTLDPDLNEYITKEIDLRNLPIKGIGADFDENGEFDFILPESNKKITFKLMTVGLGDYINAEAERRKKNNITPFLITKLESTIMSIDGNRDKLFISSFVKILSPKDRLALGKYIKTIEPDVILEGKFKSSIRGVEYTDDFMLGIDFFYPQDLD